MKKLLIPAIVAVAAISGVIGYNETAKTQRSAIDMANIDALTDSEESRVYRYLSPFTNICAMGNADGITTIIQGTLTRVQ